MSYGFVDSFRAGTGWNYQNKLVKLVHLVGFMTKKFVTMRGHMNVKNKDKLFTLDFLLNINGNRNSSVNVVTDCTLEVRNISLLQRVHNGSGAHPDSNS
jgi:hypothetical protein